MRLASLVAGFVQAFQVKEYVLSAGEFAGAWFGSALDRCGTGCLECPARPGRDGAGAEEPGGAIAGGGREREPCVLVHERQPAEHRGGGREERRLPASRRERGGRAEPDQRELGEPDRQPVTGVDRLQVAVQLLNRLAGREVATVPVHRDEVDPQVA